jgi:hypothetical protein
MAVLEARHLEVVSIVTAWCQVMNVMVVIMAGRVEAEITEEAASAGQ